MDIFENISDSVSSYFNIIQQYLVIILVVNIFLGIILPIILHSKAIKEGKKVSMGSAYLLWWFWGVFGGHRFYLGKVGTGILWLLTGGLCGLGWLIDIFLVAGHVNDINEKHGNQQEMKEMRKDMMDIALNKQNIPVSDQGVRSMDSNQEYNSNKSEHARPIQPPVNRIEESLPSSVHPKTSYGSSKDPYLICMKGEFNTARIPLTEKPVNFGRDPLFCQFVFNDNKNISRRHCALNYDKARQGIFVIDMSTNGTFLNSGQRLPKNVNYTLKPGDIFYLGDREEIFMVDFQ